MDASLTQENELNLALVEHVLSKQRGHLDAVVAPEVIFEKRPELAIRFAKKKELATSEKRLLMSGLRSDKVQLAQEVHQLIPERTPIKWRGNNLSGSVDGARSASLWQPIPTDEAPEKITLSASPK